MCVCWSFQQCPTTVKNMALISLPPFICDLFPLINLWLVVKLLTRDVGIHSLISWRTGEIWDSMLSLLLKMVFQLQRQVKGAMSPLKTAQRWAHKFQNYGEFQRRYSTGHPHCSTREEDKAICRVHDENPFCSANQIKAAVNFPGTSRMVMNRLRDANIHCWRAVSKEA